MRYGQIREQDSTAAEFRVMLFINDLGEQRGNSGFSGPTQEFLEKNKSLIEDAFTDNDSAYILPKTREFAKELFKQVLHNYDPEEDYGAEADEVDWLKMDDRYWLRLWWD